jgi:hypothetical protein
LLDLGARLPTDDSVAIELGDTDTPGGTRTEAGSDHRRAHSSQHMATLRQRITAFGYRAGAVTGIDRMTGFIA